MNRIHPFYIFLWFAIIVVCVLGLSGVSVAAEIGDVNVSLSEPWYSYATAATFVASALANIFKPHTFVGKLLGFLALNFRVQKIQSDR